MITKETNDITDSDLSLDVKCKNDERAGSARLICLTCGLRGWECAECVADALREAHIAWGCARCGAADVGFFSVFRYVS